MRRAVKPFARAILAAGAGLLALSACTDGGSAENADIKALIAEAQALRPEQLEAKANEISQNDYRMFRSLMAAGGLDEELGGAAQGDAALRGLMLQFRQQMLGARADLPRMLKIAGDSDAPGLTGLGASFFAGGVMTGMLVRGSGSASEPSGSFNDRNKDGSFSASFNEQQVSTSSTFTGEIMGMQGKVTTKVTLDKCPKIDGAISIDFLSDSSLTKVGSTAGANVKVMGKLTWYVNDDAEFGNDLDVDVHVENAAFGGSRGANGSFVDYTEKTSSVVASNNGGVVNRASSKATADDRATAAGAAQFARVILMSTAYSAKDAFQSGQCVKLEPTSDPAKRSGVNPSTRFAITAAPRSKIDGSPTKGTVKAVLTGGSAVDPAGAKVPADAKFTYVAPDTKDKKASVAFEARSKRGIGKATLAFDTMGRAYSAVGGGGDFKGSGNICSLAEPFTISGMGVTNTFTPSSETGGSYSYSGSIMGFGVYGAGTYSVKADETGGTLTATGPGTVITPMGKRTAKGTEVYKLTPLSDCGG